MKLPATPKSPYKARPLLCPGEKGCFRKDSPCLRPHVSSLSFSPSLLSTSLTLNQVPLQAFKGSLSSPCLGLHIVLLPPPPFHLQTQARPQGPFILRNFIAEGNVSGFHCRLTTASLLSQQPYPISINNELEDIAGVIRQDSHCGPRDKLAIILERKTKTPIVY